MTIPYIAEEMIVATDKTRYKDVKVRMPKYLKREWAFFLGDCGRKKYNPLPSDKLLKGAQLICNKPFLRIFARLNIQNTDFVFVRHCNNSFLTIKIPLYRVIQRG